MQNKRAGISNLRVIAIFLVVLGHSIILYSRNWGLYPTEQTAPLFDHLKMLINTVQMPLFFTLSGFCFYWSFHNASNLSNLLLSRAKRILLPFLFFGAIWLAPIRMLIGYPGYQGLSYPFILIRMIILGGDSGHLWFLPTLFHITLASSLVLWTAKTLKAPRLGPIALFLSMAIAYHSPINMVPFQSLASSYGIWFALGYAIHGYENHLTRYKKTLVLALAIPTLGLFALSFAGWEIALPRAILLLWTLSSVLEVFLTAPQREWRPLDIISRDSMGLYLFHSPLIYFSFTYWPNIHPVLMLIVNLFGFGGVALLLTELLRKAKMGWAIGE